jgi:DNA-binding CsgD family transcriptional regulator
VLDGPGNRRLGVAELLFGRSSELATIAAFVERAGIGGEALLLLGEPGVGKTALLDATASVAAEAGMSVLRAAGAQFEADLPFSGLHQVLLPLLDEFGRLDSVHGGALSAALGYGASPAPDRMLVSAATLAVLRHAAADSPVLVVVDDMPWMDRATARVLGFVARRLAGTRVGFLAASRTGEEGFFERSGLPARELAPLDSQAAQSLLADRFPALAPALRQRVLSEAQGNPLALLELPAALMERQWASGQDMPPTLPLTRRLLGLFGEQLQQLSPASRQVLLMLALDSTGDARVARPGSYTPAEPGAVEAEQAGLVHSWPGTRRLDFRHPLVRAAVVELSTSSERRAVHQALAELAADQPDRQAWHFAEAATGPDERVAELLERSARRILRRGDAVGAVSALTRAAELSPGEADRGRRLAEAAYLGAEVTGDIRRAARLLDDAWRAEQQPQSSLQAATAAAYLLLNGDGDVETAHRLLAGALDAAVERPDISATVVDDALNTLMLLCYWDGSPERWNSFYDAIETWKSSVSEAMYLASQTWADPARTAVPALAQLDTAIERLTGELDPVKIIRVAIAGLFADRLASCRAALWRVVRDGRDGGAVTSAINALILLARDDFPAGRWDQAEQLVNEAIQMCEQLDYPLLAGPARMVHALLAAVRGNEDQAQELADQLLRWAAPRGIRWVQCYAWHARALAALGRGDFERAYQQLTMISPAGELALYVPYAMHVSMDLVEAAVRTGRDAEAVAHVTALHQAGIAKLSPRLAMLVSGAAALAATGPDAIGFFEQALAVDRAGRWPFELARVELAYGERLRRDRATKASRRHLAAALETFESLGARPWAARAAGELRVIGLTSPRQSIPGPASLTAQEREIALLAATGLSNKQIGERLFLSHRTIGAHLYQIFPKLGITSRAALRDALANIPEPDKDAPVPRRNHGRN